MATLVDYGWVEWLAHTNFSFLIGASHPHEMIKQASEYAYKGLGIADYDGVYGIARAYRERRQACEALKLFYGSEIHLANDFQLPLLLQDTLVLFAQTHKGYFHLCRILNEAHRESKDKAFVTPETLLSLPVDDLVAFQPMRGLLRRHGPSPAWEARLGKLREHFHGRFYFLMSRHLNPSEDCWIAPTLTLAKKLASPVLLSQDSFFHDRPRKRLHDFMHAIRHNRTIEHVSEHLFVNSERCLHPLSYLEKLFGSFPFYEKALRASCDLAETFAFDLDELRYVYPKEMLPPAYSAQAYLEKLVWEGAHRIYGAELPEKTKKILDHELALVKILAFPDYFLTVWDIVKWARAQGILCQGRGSAANSAVCFVLGITSLDPETSELLFERFISLERGDPPDIDVDFEHERREEVIQYIYERYGRDKASMVCNVICFKSRGAIRFVGKALGVPEKLLDEGARLLRRRGLRQGGSDKALGKLASLQKPTENEAETLLNPHLLKLWGFLAEEIKGFPRHLGIHSGGFMLADKPLAWLVPTEPATMEGRTVIQWSKDDIEGLGFFKIDILALGMLTALRKSFALIREFYGHKIGLSQIPSDDLPTYRMIQNAETVGTFQIESRAQISFLPKHRPQHFYDLVVQVAIIRPGPIEGGMIHAYLNRRRGREAVVIPHPKLEAILGRTYGVPIFQEQVMRVAIAVGGFSPGEADELRKKIGAFTMKPDDVGPLLEKLQNGMRAHGIKEEFIASMCQHIQGFSSYGFPESHAASFALLAYASAYVKCHYPEAFLVAMLNSQPLGFYSIDTLIKTARHGDERGGVGVRPVCLRRSDWDATLEKDEKASRPFAVRLGLRLVRGLCEENVRNFLQKRTHLATNCGLEELLKLRCFSRLDWTALAAADAFHSWGIARRAAIWLAEAAPFCHYLEDEEREPAFAQESEWENVQGDYRALGTSLGTHPAKILREQAWVYPVPREQIVLGQDLLKLRSGSFVTIFGMVLVRQAPPTASGMLFITLEDESSYRPNLVVRPHVYQSFAEVIESHSFLCVSGKLELVDNAYNIIVSRFHAPEGWKAEVITLQKQMQGAEEFALSRNYC
ncbi:MAG: error-prone DNA polymerase [Deltaproteobacteria bacterium]|nr:error-prone DNA polymerase [Deltaproteobacteria bacterium]